MISRYPATERCSNGRSTSMGPTLIVLQSPPFGVARLKIGRSAPTVSNPECGKTAGCTLSHRHLLMSLPRRRVRSADAKCSAAVTAPSHVSTAADALVSHQGEVAGV